MFGIDLGDPQTMWLNVTNIALGVVTLICFGVVGWGAVTEVVARLRRRWGLALESDDHAFVVPGLGTTMADGGEKLEREPKAKE
jgi:hypothetical protein